MCSLALRGSRYIRFYCCCFFISLCRLTFFATLLSLSLLHSLLCCLSCSDLLFIYGTQYWARRSRPFSPHVLGLFFECLSGCFGRAQSCLRRPFPHGVTANTPPPNLSSYFTNIFLSLSLAKSPSANFILFSFVIPPSSLATRVARMPLPARAQLMPPCR